MIADVVVVDIRQAAVVRIAAVQAVRGVLENCLLSSNTTTLRLLSGLNLIWEHSEFYHWRSPPKADKEFLFLFDISFEAVAAKLFPNKGNLIVPKP